MMLRAVAHHEIGTKLALTALITPVIENPWNNDFLSLPATRDLRGIFVAKR
jgi:hypothetical protein